MFIVLEKFTKQRGETLVDSLCGLFIISIGLGLYLQTNQMIQTHLDQERNKLILVKKKKKKAAPSTKS